MIKSIRIQNLRSIKDSTNIVLRPIVILLGANSSGKSTFLRSFPLFTQSVNKRLREPIAWFDNSLVDFGDYKTAKNKYVDEEEGISFSFDFSFSNPPFLHFQYLYRGIDTISYEELSSGNLYFELKGDHRGTYIRKIKIRTVNSVFRLEVDDRNAEVHYYINDAKIEFSEKLYFNYNTEFSILPTLYYRQTAGDPINISTYFANKLSDILKKFCDARLQKVQRFEKIFNYARLDKHGLLKVMKESSGISSLQKNINNWTVKTLEFEQIYGYFTLMKMNFIVNVINRDLALFYHQCDYIAPMRAEATRFYRIQGLQVNSIDSNGHNLLEFVASLTPKEKNNYDEFVESILGVTVDVPSESGMKNLRLKTKNGDFSIMDVGYGYSQILPVITKLWHTTFIKQNIGTRSRLSYRDLEKSILLMEQPELHLHPAMQAKVADTLIKTIDSVERKEDCPKLIVETHSQAMINRLGRRIREGKISTTDVSVLLFSKDNDNRNTVIKQIEFTEKGQLKDWPYGFFDPED